MLLRSSMSNPLETLARPIPFDKIAAHHVQPAITTLLEKGELALTAIEAGTGQNYQDTFAALEDATLPLETAMGIIEHLESVRTTQDFRAAYNEVLPKVSAFWSSIALRAGLYKRLKSFAKSSAVKSLTPTQARFVEKTLDDFERSGAGLDDNGKKKLMQLDQELSQTTTTYGQNVLDGTVSFELIVDESRISGLPQTAVVAAQEAASQKNHPGKYRFNLQAPAVVAILSHADDQSLREEIWQAFNQRGRGIGKDNVPLVAKILELRKAKAQLLGFADFADLATSDRMAKTGAVAGQFVEQLRKDTQAAFEVEQQELQAFRQELEGNDAPELKPWDVGYYAEKLRKSRYNFDEEELRPYFSASSVLQGAFELAETLFNIKIVETQLPTWDSEAKSYEIADAAGTILGEFYTDLYPRENKRDGAWMHGLIAATPGKKHLALFCANAQPPTENSPSLMSFRDVETVFHEFGHLLHHCMSNVEVRSLACTRVAQDFVELPSQILENWCSEKLALDRFAQHYKTGATLPTELVDKLLAARNFRAASAQMRQLGFASVDLGLHRNYQPKEDGNVNDYANQILSRFSATRLPMEYGFIASFGH